MPGRSASMASTRRRRPSIAGSGSGSPVALSAVSSFSAVTGVTGVQASIGAGFGVTSAIASAVTGVTARPSNLASRASSAMVAPQLVGLDRIQAPQPPADALRLGAFAAGVGLGQCAGFLQGIQRPLEVEARQSFAQSVLVEQIDAPGLIVAPPSRP